MPTQEERLNALERTVAFLEKKIDNTDIQSVNHNATMLLGLVYTQQADIREIKINVATINQRLDRLETKFDEHTSLLTQILARLPQNP